MERKTVSELETIYISEWSYLGPEKIKNNYGIEELREEDAEIIRDLEEQRKLELRELKEGLEIKTNSHVGLVKLSNFQLIITPKIDKFELAKMLSFTLDLEDINFRESEVQTGVKEANISDIIALTFINKAEEIFLSGLVKRYKEKEKEISSCRGKIIFNKVARDSSPGLSLPCRYQELTPDISENRLILASLNELFNWVSNHILKIKLQIAAEKFSAKISREPLSGILLEEAKRDRDRLSEHYQPLIELAEIILKQKDFRIISGERGFNSFLIDMNDLFEKFLYRYLLKICPKNMGIKYQSRLANKFISDKGSDYSMIPDYKFYYEGKLKAIGDAKYKNYSKREIQSGDLYQLTTYSIAGRGKTRQVFLYYPLERSEKVEKQYSLKNNLGEERVKITAVGLPLKRMLNNLDNKIAINPFSFMT